MRILNYWSSDHMHNAPMGRPLLKGEGRTYGKKAVVARGEWGELRVTARGDLDTVYLNGQKLHEVEDGTFAEAGKVGVWTKADSVTYFDELKVVAR